MGILISSVPPPLRPPPHSSLCADIHTQINKPDFILFVLSVNTKELPTNLVHSKPDNSSLSVTVNEISTDGLGPWLQQTENIFRSWTVRWPREAPRNGTDTIWAKVHVKLESFFPVFTQVNTRFGDTRWKSVMCPCLTPKKIASLIPFSLKRCCIFSTSPPTVRKNSQA